MFFEIIVLIIALAVLVKSSIITIDNALRLSKLTGVNQVVIGFIFVAAATSLPELSIAVVSSMRSEGIISAGNILGANVVNLTLIFGLIALFGKNVKRGWIEIDEAIIFTTIVAFFALILGTVGFLFGIFSIVMFYIFFRTFLDKGVKIKNHARGIIVIEEVKAVIYLVASAVFVIISANIVTDSVIKLSAQTGLAEGLIGAVILSLGTTLPELSIALAAIKKNDIGLAIGDGLGSIVTNITLVLGIASIINPIALGSLTKVLIALIFINLVFLFVMSRLKINRTRGVILILCYIGYIIFVLT